MNQEPRKSILSCSSWTAPPFLPEHLFKDASFEAPLQQESHVPPRLYTSLPIPRRVLQGVEGQGIYRVLTWIRHQGVSLDQAPTISTSWRFWAKTPIFAVFSMSLVCVVGTFVSYIVLEFCIHSRILSSLFQTLRHQDVYGFLEMPNFYSIWGLDSDSLDKQAFAPIFQFEVLCVVSHTKKVLTWNRNRNHVLTSQKWYPKWITC